MRPNRGLQIVTTGNQVKRIEGSTYKVKSQSGKGVYSVLKVGEEWKCECADFMNRGVVCKHIYAVTFSQSLRNQVAVTEKLAIEPETDIPDNWNHCGSTAVLRRGFITEKNKKVQRFWCKDCKKTFVLNAGFRGMKNDAKIVTVALDAYFRGMSLRDVREHLLQFHGAKVHYVTILRWIAKYTKIISDYVEQYQPSVGDTWHVDEMMLDIEGKKQWLWNVMDSETRFLLASRISKKRDVKSARAPIHEALDRAGVQPRTVITDGLRAYDRAVKRELHSQALPRTQHVRLPSIRNKVNNNRIERLHGTIRERHKVQRGLKEGASINIADGHRIFYNYMRGHMALENEKTPAEKAGIEINLKGNKWMDLIKQVEMRQASYFIRY